MLESIFIGVFEGFLALQTIFFTSGSLLKSDGLSSEQGFPGHYSPHLIQSLVELQKNGFKLGWLKTNDNSGNNLLKALKDTLVNEGIIYSYLLDGNLLDEEIRRDFKNLKTVDPMNSFLICRETEKSYNPVQKLEKTFGISTLILQDCNDWLEITKQILTRDRLVKLERNTEETRIAIVLNLDGSGKAEVTTGLNFFDHMLDNFAKHSLVDLNLNVDGDLEVDEHHTIEDTAIALAQAFKKAWGEKRGIDRYGFVLPMDESEVQCSMDLSGRGHLEWSANFKREYVGDFPTELLQHFYYSFCINAGVNMNMKISGENDHHQVEASFKCFAKCIKQSINRSSTILPSTKGVL